MTDFCTNYAIYVEDGFSLISYSSLLGALHAANIAANDDVIDWTTLSAKGGAVFSDTGVRLDTASFGGETRNGGRRNGDSILVLLSAPLHEQARRLLTTRVRDALSRGAKVLSIGEGTRLLCEEGMLEGRRCAVHWSQYGISLELFPQVRISRSFREQDGPFHTCAGELSTIDAAMELIEAQLGAKVSDRISTHILRGPLRPRGERQDVPDISILRRFDTPLRKLVDLMLDNISDPLPLSQLVVKISLSRRQVERLFCQHLGVSPMKYYLNLRLERANDLLQHSHMAVVDVAIATGFVSHSHFSKTFKTLYGRTPADVRRLAFARTEADDFQKRGSAAMNDKSKRLRIPYVGAMPRKAGLSADWQ